MSLLARQSCNLLQNKALSKFICFFHGSQCFSQENVHKNKKPCSQTTRKDKKVPPSSKYQQTVFLPSTKLPLRVKDILEHELQIQKEFEWNKQYERQYMQTERRAEFVLHDGPPYANGSLHIGHALNKILKDITVRQKLIEGFKVHYKPGWDCHGLPIELQAMKMGSSPGAGVKSLSPLELRKISRQFAESCVKEQKKTFERWGVLGDWNNAYLTAQPSYVARQLRLFDRLKKKGLIFQAHMPVFYSPSSRTTLAEAELVYKDDHISPDLTLALRCASFSTRLKETLSSLGADTLHLPVFTTTPWTLPFNRAVCYNPKLPYCLVALSRGDKRVVGLWAKQLLPSIDTTGWHWQHLADINIEELEAVHYHHPLDTSQLCPLLPSDHVTAERGTGLVHTAPAHGQEDYLVGVDHGLQLTSAVGDDGCYEESLGPPLAGLSVLEEGNAAVLSLLDETSKTNQEALVLRAGEMRHSYPYDWRTGKPVMIRATKQWFVNTQAVRDDAMSCLEGVRIFPNDGQGKKNFGQHLQRRHWCISRQRVWGVPLPVFYDACTGDLIEHDDIVKHVSDIIEREGSDAWWRLSERELLPPVLVQSYDARGETLPVKGSDILDIWMDSGVTWLELGGRTADLVIEGLDQYRGWFQSTLVTSVADRGTAPFKRILVHGFTVDEHGRKMSKSAGNVVDPKTITEGSADIKGRGTDLLRWWVCRTGTLHKTPTCGENILASYNEEVQRLRSIMRFMLGCLSDYDPAKDAPNFSDLSMTDRFALHRLFAYDQNAWINYELLQYHNVARETVNFITTQLSQLYFPSIKHRLYCSPRNSLERRSAQHVLHCVLQCLLLTMTPIVPHLTHDVARHLTPGESPQLKIRSPLPLEYHDPHLEELLAPCLRVREQLFSLHALSGLAFRTTKLDLTLSADSPAYEALTKLQSESYSDSSILCDILQVASVTIIRQSTDNLTGKEDEVSLSISESPLQSCLRCRKVRAALGSELCRECDLYIHNHCSETPAEL
ncbi:isoleucine--tRNA ligase isoform X2 [Hyalella azteca]|uniref:isoleucine--tRNA ligase n=1 Tax=Hyalella azteca TaxID=294128 RepID=A0A8B7NMM5_HYAAZ|nr:isoleucine--tRNA ligase isoform X2 [Hyalella azteca]